MIPMKTIKPSAAHVRVREKMMAVIKTEAANMDAPEILAIAAYTVGQMVALQDHRKMTPDMAMEIVAQNVEAGNAHAIAEVASAGGRLT